MSEDGLKSVGRMVRQRLTTMKEDYEKMPNRRQKADVSIMIQTIEAEIMPLIEAAERTYGNTS